MKQKEVDWLTFCSRDIAVVIAKRVDETHKSVCEEFGLPEFKTNWESLEEMIASKIRLHLEGAGFGDTIPKESEVVKRIDAIIAKRKSKRKVISEREK